MTGLISKPLFKRILAALAVAALAFSAEWIYFQSQKKDFDYPYGDLPAAVFDSWEVEAVPEGGYRMLAENSYFLYTMDKPVAVQTLVIRFEREQDDSTVMVLYFGGLKNSVESEFSASLTRTGDRQYTAILEADRVDYIRFMPTGKVRSHVDFWGMVLNPQVSQPAFTWTRMILWVFLAAWVYVLYNLIAAAVDHPVEEGHRRKFRLPYRVPNVWVSVYIVLGAIIMLAAFQAPRIYSVFIGLESYLLPGAFLIFTFLYCGIWLLVKRIEATELKVAVIALTAGCVFAVANAPLQAPDEYQHFLRAWTVSYGRLDYDYDYRYPDDVYHLIESFQPYLHRAVIGSEGNTADHFQMYKAVQNDPVTGDLPAHTSQQTILPYIPAALGILVTRLLGGDALACLYAARLCNVALFSASSWYAVKIAARYRGALIALIFLPLTVFMTSSVSYDAPMLSAAVLFIGFLMSDEFGPRSFAVSAGLFAFLFVVKPPYLFLCLLLFLIPPEQYKVKRRRIICLLILLLAAAAAFLLNEVYASIFSNIPSPAQLEGANPASQLEYVLKNPGETILKVMVDSYFKSFYIDKLGLFGWLDITLPLTGIASPVMLVVVAALYADTARQQGPHERLIHSGVLILTWCAISFGFYILTPTTGSTDIAQIQARYFLPIVPSAVALMSAAMSPVIRFREAVKNRNLMRDRICVYICGAAALLGGTELFLMNYLQNTHL